MNTTEEIWNKYHTNLLAFIRKRVNDKTEAEDILSRSLNPMSDWCGRGNCRSKTKEITDAGTRRGLQAKGNIVTSILGRANLFFP